MPRRRLRLKTSAPHRFAPKPLMPFSLIFQPSELDALRKIAGKYGSAVASKAGTRSAGPVIPGSDVPPLCERLNTEQWRS
jgi:hypothetical protein